MTDTKGRFTRLYDSRFTIGENVTKEIDQKYVFFSEHKRALLILLSRF